MKKFSAITSILVFFLLSCKSVNNKSSKKEKSVKDSINYNEYEAEKIKEYQDEEYNLYLEEVRESQEQEIDNDPR
jgi:hypothetical protein